MAFIKSKVDVPILLPALLSKNTKLDPNTDASVAWVRGAGMAGYLPLVLGKRDQLLIEYGVALFDGCGADSARPTRVLGHPALINTFSGQSAVIWPATPRHSQGRYGLSGPFTGKQILELANSMKPASYVLRLIERDVGC